jgi:hypothetical protein
MTGWWFGYFLFIFPYIGNNNPQLTFTPSFFRGGGLTHQADDESKKWSPLPGQIRNSPVSSMTGLDGDHAQAPESSLLEGLLGPAT